MKTTSPKSPATSQTPVFPKTLHHVRVRTEESVTKPKAEKRDNIFSKSRDTREDRSARQMKTSKSPRTFSRSR